MRYPLQCLFLCLVCCLTGQTFPTFNTLQDDMQEQACPFDSTIRVVQPMHWQVYQTMDNRWHGDIDSTRCFHFRQEANSNWALSLSDIDQEKALFFRYRGPMEEINSNAVYAHQGGFSTEVNLRYDTDCPGDLCSGTIIDYLVFDTFRDSLVRRSHRSPQHKRNTTDGPCFVTDNVELLLLSDYIVKFTFEGAIESGQTFTPFGFSSSSRIDEIYPVTAFPFPEWSFTSDSTLEAWINNLVDDFSVGPYLVQQRTDTFPDENHFTYVEAYPDFPIDRQLDIYIRLERDDQLLTQPFTALRGGMVDGSDTLRHHLFVDADYLTNGCNVLPFETPVPGNTTYIFSGGNLRFGGPEGCLMLFDGGEVIVDSAAHFVYGQGGLGLLGLAQDAKITLTEGSTMVIDNKVLLSGAVDESDPQAYVNLVPGSHLVFGSGSSLKRYHPHGNMYLNVRMLGGTIDDSALTAEERGLIRKIYPPVTLPAEVSMSIKPNPVQNTNQVWIATKSEAPLPYQVFALDGRLLANGRLDFIAPQRFAWSLPDGQLATGTYVIRVMAADHTTSALFFAP